MTQFQQARSLLDEINAAIAGYDPVLKEKARDILLEVAFADRGGEAVPQPKAEAAAEPQPAPPTHEAGATRRPRRLADEGLDPLLARWTPTRASEKALLGAYYLEVVRRQKPITSQAINNVLKQHGLTVSNITRAIETNLNASPPLMDQLAKRGTTRQARKQYRMTAEGIRYVEERLGSD